MGFFHWRGDEMSKYTEYRKKLYNKIYRLNKQGIHLDIPTEKILTEKQLKKSGVKGRKITAQTIQLRKMLANFNKLEAYSDLTGEIGTVSELKKSVKEYSQSATENYAKFSDIVIDNFRAKFSRMPPDISSRINGLLTQLINEQGTDDVAVAIENLAPKMIESLVASGYTTDYIVEQLGLAIIENMPNASEQYKYDIADAYESYETGYEIGDY